MPIDSGFTSLLLSHTAAKEKLGITYFMCTPLETKSLFLFEYFGFYPVACLVRNLSKGSENYCVRLDKVKPNPKHF